MASPGEVMNGRVDTTPSEVIRVLIEKNLAAEDAPAYQRYARLLGWADKIRRPACARQRRPARPGYRRGGVRCRGHRVVSYEHMFFGEGKIGPCAR